MLSSFHLASCTAARPTHGYAHNHARRVHCRSRASFSRFAVARLAFLECFVFPMLKKVHNVNGREGGKKKKTRYEETIFPSSKLNNNSHHAVVPTSCAPALFAPTARPSAPRYPSPDAFQYIPVCMLSRLCLPLFLSLRPVSRSHFCLTFQRVHLFRVPEFLFATPS